MDFGTVKIKEPDWTRSARVHPNLSAALTLVRASGVTRHLHSSIDPISMASSDADEQIEAAAAATHGEAAAGVASPGADTEKEVRPEAKFCTQEVYLLWQDRVTCSLWLVRRSKNTPYA